MDQAVAHKAQTAGCHCWNNQPDEAGRARGGWVDVARDLSVRPKHLARQLRPIEALLEPGEQLDAVYAARTRRLSRAAKLGLVVTAALGVGVAVLLGPGSVAIVSAGPGLIVNGTRTSWLLAQTDRGWLIRRRRGLRPTEAVVRLSPQHLDDVWRSLVSQVGSDDPQDLAVHAYYRRAAATGQPWH